MKSGKYTFVREIGRGASGTVWLGRDNVLHRDIAMKRVGFAPGGSSPDLDRAEREARLAASLNHPNVVAVFDLVVHEGSHWLVMEYVPGLTLSQMVRETGPMDAERAAMLLAQVADALCAAHQAGITHRDVKPSNVLVGEGDQAKLTDFGIARAAEDDSLTQTGLVSGSPAYLSPEVATGRQATPASDVWAIGATLYHLLAGQPPYETSDHVLSTMYRIVHEKPPRLPGAGWLVPVLEHTMAPDPRDRWSMEQVRDVLAAGPGPDEEPVGRVVTTPPAASATSDEGDSRTAESLPQVAPTTVAPALGATGTGQEHATATPERSWVAAHWRWLALAAVVVVASIFTFSLGLQNGTPGPGPRTPAADTPATPGEPATTDTATSTEPAPTTDEQMETFVADYLAAVTTEPADAWGRLTPQFQEESGGFDSYRGFWSTVQRARLLSVQADPDDMSVRYVVRYTFVDGGKDTDRVSLRLVRDGDRLLVAGES